MAKKLGYQTYILIALVLVGSLFIVAIFSGTGTAGAAFSKSCGNGVVNPKEVCDGTSRACTTSNGYTGVQSCNSQCNGYNTCVSSQYCGDNKINGYEVCDDSDLNNQTCVSQGFPYGGMLQCNAQCSGFVTSSCITQICGNGIIEGTEVCDGNTQSCTVNGYNGVQQCNAQCNGYNSCSTTESCGDGIVNGNEQCDGTNLNWQNCTTQGFWGGTLSCTSNCLFNTTGCTVPCTNECPLSGSSQCSGSSVQTCGNYDSDICLEWSQATACSSGQTCSNGQCVTNTSCTNECTPGSPQCLSNTTYKSCGYGWDSDPCYEWSQPLSCPQGTICIVNNGILNCVPSATNSTNSTA